MALEELTGTGPAPAGRTGCSRSVRDADLRRLGIDDQVLAVARTLTDEAALHAVSPLLPEQQADVLAALAAGYDVEQVWADVVAPRIPDDPIDPDDLAAAVDRTRGRIALVDGPGRADRAVRPADGAVAGVPAPVAGGDRLPSVVLGQRAGHRRPGHRQDGGRAAPRQAPRRQPASCRRTRCCSPATTVGSPSRWTATSTRLLDADQRSAVLVQNVDRWARGVVTAAHGSVAHREGRRAPRPPAARRHGDRCALLARLPREEWGRWCSPTTCGPRTATWRAPRRGRGRGLTKGQKRSVWAALSRFVDGLRADHLLDVPHGGRRGCAARRRPRPRRLSGTSSSTRSRTCTRRSGGCCAPRSRSARTTCSSPATRTSASTATTSACAPSASASPAGRAGCGSTTARAPRSCSGRWACSATSPSPTSTTGSTRSPATGPRCTASPRSSGRRRARLRKRRSWRSR